MAAKRARTFNEEDFEGINEEDKAEIKEEMIKQRELVDLT